MPHKETLSPSLEMSLHPSVRTVLPIYLLDNWKEKYLLHDPETILSDTVMIRAEFIMVCMNEVYVPACFLSGAT